MKTKHILKILIFGIFLVLGSLLSFSVNSASAATATLKVNITPSGAVDAGAQWEYRRLTFSGWGSWNGPYEGGTTLDIGFYYGLWIQVRGTTVDGFTTPAILSTSFSSTGTQILYLDYTATTTTTTSSTTTSTTSTTVTTSTTTTSSTVTTTSSTSTTTSSTVTTTSSTTTTTISGTPCMDISETPLETQFQAAPATIMFVLDDSISMKFDITVESSDYNGCYQVGSTYYGYVFGEGGNTIAGLISSSIPKRYWKTQWYEVNRSYYNPTVDYRPWPNKSNASTTSPLRDPELSSDTVNLGSEYNDDAGFSIKNAHYYVKGSDDKIYLVNFVSGSRVYYEYTAGEADTYIGSGDFSSSTTTMPGGLSGIIANTDAADLQNFANWFSYFRRREQSAKNAVAEALMGIEGVRVGFQYISEYNSASAISYGLKKVNVNESGTVVDETADLLSELYDIDSDSSVGTTLRGGLRHVGEYYKSGAPYYSAADGGACQQSFAIVVTDGFWNNQDSSYLSSTDHDGDGYSKTLADVAQYYYVTDLSTTLANLVPATAADPNQKQHMVTYGIAFGVTGTLDQTTVPTTWPEIQADHPTTIDDLWHATLNGKGKFLSAASPEALTAALQLLMQNIEGRLGSGASVSVNGEKIYSGSRIFQSSYSSDTWTGDIRAYAIGSTGNINSDAYIWTAQGKLELQDWNSGREIATFSGSTGTPFRYDDLTTAQQTLLNENQVNYIRGDDTYEEDNGGSFRTRTKMLGDIVHSIPVLFDGYIYAGGNDGMLHAFSAENGQEVFAYVPNIVFSNLGELTDPAYSHKYYIDNSPYTAEISTSTSLLVSGLGRGGKGYFCLDISTPGSNTEDNAGSWVKWEYPDAGTPSAEIADLGYSFSRAFIVNSRIGWVVIFGNGYMSANGNAVLFVLDALTGDKLAQIDTGVGSCNGLSTPAVIDVDNDYIVDYVYAGDLKGNMWKFDLTGDTAASWEVAYKSGSTPKSLFQAKNDAGAIQPITAQPDVMRFCDLSKPGYMVFFGTGINLDFSDLTDANVQSVYGIWDFGDDTDNAEYIGSFERPDLSNISGVTLVEQTVVWSGTNPNAANDYMLRVLSDNETDWSVETDFDSNEEDNPADGANVGWYFDLPTQYEKVVAGVTVRDGVLVVISYIPNDSACSTGGTSWLMEMDACSGGRLGDAQLDINEDGQINDQDLVNIGTVDDPIWVAPTGIQYPTMVHEPVIVQLDKGVDIKYSSDATGGIQVTREKGERTGIYNWREMD